MGSQIPEITQILEDLNKLLEEVQIEGHHFRVPLEMRPENKKAFTIMDSGALIEESLKATYHNAVRLREKLQRLDPEFFEARLGIFFEEWEKSHSGCDLRVFYHLKFLLEPKL